MARQVRMLIHGCRDFADASFPGLKAVFDNKAALLCAVMASFGGLTFGYDQGVISVTLVMDHFLKVFIVSIHRIAPVISPPIVDRTRDRLWSLRRELQQRVVDCYSRAWCYAWYVRRSGYGYNN